MTDLVLTSGESSVVEIVQDPLPAVVVHDETHYVVVDEDVYEVVTSEPEVAGVVTVEVVGPPGPPGPVRATYPHRQATPAAEWPVDHMLGYPSEPTILLDSNPTEPVWMHVTHVSVDRAIITLPKPESGWAYF